jgi:4-amino-4-deoxy-L-arabinose transferase-like glycosyltransferase
MNKATSKVFHTAKPPEAHEDRNTTVTKPSPLGRKSAIVLGSLLILFVVLQCLLPLRTAIQIGGDEGFELAKATLCLKGYHLYTDIWNDQPPLHTFLLTQILKHVSMSVLGPRLLTSAFALLLLTSVFLICRRLGGLTPAAVATLLLIASPGFLTLGSSCMLEIPALASAVAGLCLFLVVSDKTRPWVAIAAGVLFGVALEIKLVVMILLPLVVLILWQHHRTPTAFLKTILVFAAALGISFVLLDLLIDQGAFLLHFQQTWVSHFASAKSFEYGSPDDHPFEWIILPRNWDTTIPALVGICVLLKQRARKTLLPLAWFGLTFAIFAFHRPWWSYYYVHLAIPLCWCAAIGLDSLCQQVLRSNTRFLAALLGLYCLGAVSWMGGRLYLQIMAVRTSPQTYSSLVLTEIKDFKQFTDFMYADKQIFSFHAGIPLPPTLAVMVLKRLWAGDLTNDKIAAEMSRYKPGLILLANDTRMVPFKVLMDSEYRLVYEDGDCRLFALKSIANKAAR